MNFICCEKKVDEEPDEKKDENSMEVGIMMPMLGKVKSLDEVKIGTVNFVKKRSIRYDDAYEIVKLLGQGAFGSVYLVKQTEGEEIRAMKCISKSNLLDSNDASSVKNEIEVLKNLDHPNVMKIYEFFEDDDNMYLINEFCNGGDLAELQDKEGIFSEFLIKLIMHQIFLAVNYLHKNNVLHGDIKRENILCATEEGIDRKPIYNLCEEVRKSKSVQSELKNAPDTKDLSQGAAEFLTKMAKYDFKLVDFGSAKMRMKEDKRKLSGVIGTAYYCAPEVINNKYGFEADEWSCGVMMYLLLSGIPPFAGDDEDQIFAEALNKEPDFNTPKLRHVSRACKDLMAKLLIKDPKKRITAEQALKEEFFTKGINIGKLLNGSLDKSLILKTFLNKKSMRLKQQKTMKKKTSVFRDSVVGYIALNFAGKANEIQIKEIFRELSSNDPTFQITKETFINTLKQKLPDLNDKELEEIFDGVDENKNGVIDYQELVRSICDEKDILSEQNVEKAFKFFDDDNNGSVSWDEIAIIVFGERQVTEEVMKEFFDEIGITKDEKGIDLETFKKMFVYHEEKDELKEDKENEESKEGEAKEEHVEAEN